MYVCYTYRDTHSCSLAKSCGCCIGGWGGYLPAGLWLVTPISAHSPDLWDVNNVKAMQSVIISVYMLEFKVHSRFLAEDIKG